MKKLIAILTLSLSASLFADTGLTYDQIVVGNFKNFEVEAVPDAPEGRKRWMGKSDKAILELIGEKSNLNSVTLIVVFAARAESEAEKLAIIQSFATVSAFLKNVDNSWDDTGKFFFPAVTKLAEGSDKECATRKNLKICINNLLPLGLLGVVVESK